MELLHSAFLILTALLGILAGAVAAIVGFGIGSILTPWVAIQFGIKTAVAAVALPHFLGTLARFWALRRFVDRKVLLGFGLTSAAGGLLGALLHGITSDPTLTIVFAVILIFAGFTGLTGLTERVRLPQRAAWLAGFLSGFLGGMVGNQGGLRAAAMMGLGVPKHAFVATATAIALIVDVARIPVYVATTGKSITEVGLVVAILTVSVLAGTYWGRLLLERIPEGLFRRIVWGAILALGVLILARALA